VETGLNTEIGRIQAMAEGARHPETPVERQLDQLGGQLAFVSAGVCAGVFVIGLLRGYGLLPMLKASISLAVAAVPEGLPTVATTTLALGIRDMRRRNVLIRRLDAVETLGSTQIICLDKTGTLTLNRMGVVQIYAGTQRVQVEDGAFFVAGRASEPQASPELRRLLEVLALCNETRIDGEGDDLELSGSPTEQALVRIAMDAGIDVAELRAGHPRLETRERSDENQYMVTVHPSDEDRRLVAVKGNPNQLLDLCGRYQVGQELRELDPDTRSAILRENERMAGDALRVLGAAYVEHGSDEGGAPTDLTWLGLVGMADPVRPGMDTLLDGFRRAGIETAMITGDQSATAYAIAKQLDLAGGQSLEMLDSTALERLEPDVLAALLREVRVFSRVSPAHKLQIVQALQKTGKIVAMTGDGVNDGPALKAADLGIAMGGGGSEVARSLSDVVITDDNLHTLQEAVRHGRTIYNNIRKSIRFLLSTNMSEIELTTVGVAVGLGEPMNPMQLLWINIMTDVFPALALAMEPPEPEILERPPRSPDEPVIRGRDLRRLGAESGVITAGSLGAYGYALWRYGPGPQASTHAFMSLTLAQLLHAMSSRSEQPCVLTSHGLPRNRYLDAAVGTSVAVQLLSVALPPLRRLLGTTRIGLVDALVIGASAALPLLINEATKQTDARQARVSTGEPVPRGVSHDQ